MGFSVGNQERNGLWHSFKNGDKDAFAAIYTLHVKDLLNYGYKVTSDRSLIEDSIQDLFVELWQSRSNVSETTSIKFYLFKALRYKITRNVKQNELAGAENIEFLNHFTYFQEDTFPSGVDVQSVQMKNLRELIQKLPKRQQEAVNLRYFHNFSNEEVAQIMGVNYQSACKFIYTALKKLKLNLRVSIACFTFFLIFF